MPHGCPGIVMCNLFSLSFVTQSSTVDPTSPSVGQGRIWVKVAMIMPMFKGISVAKPLLVDDVPIFSDHLLYLEDFTAMWLSVIRWLRGEAFGLCCLF